MTLAYGTTGGASDDAAPHLGHRSVRPSGVARPALLEWRGVDLLSPDRPDLQPHGPGHHEGRPLPPGRPAARLHDAVLPRPDPADGAARRRPPRGRTHGGRPRGGRPPGLRRQSAPALQPGDRGRPDGDPGLGRPDARPRPARQPRVPGAALQDPRSAGDRGAQGARVQRGLRGRRHLPRGDQRLAGRPPRAPRLRRARSQADAHHHRARGAPAPGRGQPAHHPPAPRWRRERGGRPAGGADAGRRGRRRRHDARWQRRRRRGGRALSVHRLRPLRHESAPRHAAARRRALREAREGLLAEPARSEHRGVRRPAPAAGGLRGRVAQAIRVPARRPRLRDRGVPARHPLAPGRARDRARREPRDPHPLLPPRDGAGRRRAPRTVPVLGGHLDAEPALRRHRRAADDRGGEGPAMATRPSALASRRDPGRAMAPIRRREP